MSGDDCCVKVAVRIRPLTASEHGNSEILSCLPPPAQGVLLSSTRAFQFDNVFGTDSVQSSVYKECVDSLVKKFLEGYHATCVAYGQTGSGKTYTMGTGFDTLRSEEEETQGIVPRAILHIFSILREKQTKQPGFQFQLHVSFLELYNEELIDLLNIKPASRKISNLTIREDGQGGIYWAGVKEEPVSSPEELFSCLQKGSLCRTTGSTDMNLTSSRSHAIFSIILRQDVPADVTVTDIAEDIPTIQLSGENSNPAPAKRLYSKFHFVDLAGSERMKKTNAVGDRAKEGISINSGLLAMGKVIHALNDGASHVPYRDSKLTRLLQDSLGGNSQTLMIACVAPTDSNFGETLNTLNYASRARNIRNRVMINQDIQAMEVHQLRAEISRLKMELMGSKGNVLIRSGSNESVGSSGNANTIKRLRRENEALKEELKQMEVEVYQLKQRSAKLYSDVAQAQSERDSLLFSKNGQSNLGAELNTDAQNVELNPVVQHYTSLINELRQKNEELEMKLSITKSSNDLGKRRTTDSSLWTVSSTEEPWYDQVDETIAKAKRDIYKEMQLTNSNLAEGSLISQSRKKLSKSDIQNISSSSDEDEPLQSSSNNPNETNAEDEMLNILDQIQSDISIKEELVSQLEKTQSEYRTMREKYEDKLRLLQDNVAYVQKERDLAIKKIETGGEDKDKVVIKNRYEEKIKKLTADISELRRRYNVTQKEMTQKQATNETLIKSMKVHVENLKKEKLRMLKQMKEKEVLIREKEVVKEREISLMKRKEKQVMELAKKLERSNHLHKIMLKKRTEEHVDAQKKLRSVMSMLKKSRHVNSPIHKRTLRVNIDSPRRSASSSTLESALSRDSNSPSNRPPNRQLFTGPLEGERQDERVSMQASFRKNLLYREIQNFITGKQVNEMADNLIEKRESLIKEQTELIREKDLLIEQVTNLENEPVKTKDIQSQITLCQQQILETDNRYEIVDAEIKYNNMRIRSIQLETAAQSGTNETSANGISPTSFVPDMNASFENALELINSVDEKEAKKLLEILMEDLISFKMLDRTRVMEIQELEKETTDLRRTVRSMRKAAVDATLEQERSRLTLQSVTAINNGNSVSQLNYSNSIPLDEDMRKLQEAFYDIDASLESMKLSRGGVLDDSNSRRRSRTDEPSKVPPKPNSTSLSVPSSQNPPLIPRTSVVNSVSTKNSSLSPVLPGSNSFPSLSILSPELPPALIQQQNVKDRTGMNVFERLHREQTIASQAKMKEIHHQNVTNPVPGIVTTGQSPTLTLNSAIPSQSVQNSSNSLSSNTMLAPPDNNLNVGASISSIMDIYVNDGSNSAISSKENESTEITNKGVDEPKKDNEIPQVPPPEKKDSFNALMSLQKAIKSAALGILPNKGDNNS